MKSLSILSGLLLCCLPFQIFGQKSHISNAQLIKNYTFYRNPDPQLNHLNYFEAKRGEMQLSDQSKMVLTAETADRNGYRHFKYQQVHAGLPIFGSHYTLHEKDGKVVTATGHYSPQVNAATKAGINAATAIAFARRAMQARLYDERPTVPVLCYIDPLFPQVSEVLCLAYQVDLYATAPFDRRRYFVDAASGKILTQFPLVIPEGVPSKAQTRYYGLQNIITDSIAPQEFVLRDLSRGEGIFILNTETGGPFTNPSSTWNLSNAQGDEVALDAHYCTQEYYDMMLADYNWSGQDGLGKALKVNVHGGKYANAFWDGESTTYGDGDCNYGPLTTLEVVGHEFTHGMIDYTSKLVYSGESGAINESLADMFGKMLERKTDPANFSWVVSHSFLLGPNVEPFRRMDAPKSLQMPAYYGGEFWDETNDVHTNSSIGNLWFSMLVDGRQGVNEMGTTFNVPALGVDKAGQIVFRVNKFYFSEGSDYSAFYQYSIDAAEALYGTGSLEVQAVQEAWKAVGVSGAPAGSVFDLGITGNGFQVNSFCGIGEYIPITFQVRNSGTVAYNPSTAATVILRESSNPDYFVPLSDPIAPGEVVDIQVNDWLQANQTGFTILDIYLTVDDDQLANNYGARYYDVKESAANDLEIYAYLSLSTCFSTVQKTEIYISNNSCEAVPAGTTLNLVVSDDANVPIWSSPYTLTEDLDDQGSIFFNADIPVSGAPLTLRLYHTGDPNPDNDQVDVSNQPAQTITGNYFNDFETDAGQDAYLEISAPPPTTILYQNSQFFGSTGVFEDPSDFQECVNPFAVFDEEFSSGINGTLHACVDFSSSPAPFLAFDLAQFRNFTTDTSNYLYTSMLQTKWTGSASGNQVFFGQPEGLVQHHSVPLPAFFKGAVDLRLFTQAGHWSLDPSYLNEDDFVLVDNLQLGAPTSATHELASEAVLRLSPNPARETTHIETLGNMKTLLLQNISGQTLQTWPVNASGFDLDVRNLAPGFYLLNVQLGTGQWLSRKLVKMD